MAGLTAGVACAAGGAPPTEIGNPNIPWSKHPEWWPIGYIGKTDVPFLVLQGGEDPAPQRAVLCPTGQRTARLPQSLILRQVFP